MPLSLIPLALGPWDTIPWDRLAGVGGTSIALVVLGLFVTNRIVSSARSDAETKAAKEAGEAVAAVWKEAGRLDRERADKAEEKNETAMRLAEKAAELAEGLRSENERLREDRERIRGELSGLREQNQRRAGA